VNVQLRKCQEKEKEKKIKSKKDSGRMAKKEALPITVKSLREALVDLATRNAPV
jgi:hypothetical protein